MIKFIVYINDKNLFLSDNVRVIWPLVFHVSVIVYF